MLNCLLAGVHITKSWYRETSWNSHSLALTELPNQIISFPFSCQNLVWWLLLGDCERLFSPGPRYIAKKSPTTSVTPSCSFPLLSITILSSHRRAARTSTSSLVQSNAPSWHPWVPNPVRCGNAHKSSPTVITGGAVHHSCLESAYSFCISNTPTLSGLPQRSAKTKMFSFCLHLFDSTQESNI